MKTIKTFLALILSATVLVSLLPAAAAADDNDNKSVLINLDHPDAHRLKQGDAIGDAREIDLYVMNSYDDDKNPATLPAVDLRTNLTPTVDTAVYKNVVPSFNNDVPSVQPAGVVTVGDSATLLITYNFVNEPEGTPKHQTIYTVNVKTADLVEPTFSGTIQAEVTGPGTLFFNGIDFSSKYTGNDAGKISAISITGSNPTFGMLKLDGKTYDFGKAVDIGSLGQLIFSAKEDTGYVSYDVKAYAASDIKHEKPIGNVVLTIHVFRTPEITAINDTVSKGTIMTFNEAYFKSHATLYDKKLLTIEITPTNTAYGTWYTGKKPFTTTTEMTPDQLSSLTFSANTAGTATFNWRISNDAGYSAVGDGFIVITSPTMTLKPYTTEPNAVLKGDTWYLAANHFGYTPASAAMTYIKITAVPPNTDGYLYLETALPKDDVKGYPAIAANKALTTNSVIPVSYIGSLRLATKLTSAADQTAFKWTATADVKISTAVWAEQTTYTVNFKTGGTLHYDIDMNASFAFAPSPSGTGDPTTRISYLFRTSTYGKVASYVTFKLPDKKAGMLYLNYDPQTKKGTAVGASTKYYFNKSPNLAAISFVPAADYTGTIPVSYTVYDDKGFYISGTLEFDVRNSGGGTLNLLTDKNQPLQFDAAAFGASFQSATGKALSRVAFSLPASSCGKLYYDYQPDDRSETPVASDSVYYAHGAPFLSLVSFVPAKDYTGTFSIYFTGYSSDGAYTGKVNITVADSPGGIVTYSLAQNKTVTLSGNDFSNEFIHVTGSVLSYVTFTPPQATSGTLYYQYDAETQKGTKVAASTKYYDGKTPDISDITFVPPKDFIGSAVITYTAVTAAGTTYIGKLKLNVTETAPPVSLISEEGTPVEMPASSIASAFSTLSDGEILSYVKFELPSPSYGKLYYKYSSAVDYDSAVSAGEEYYYLKAPYLSNVAFVPAAGYNGSFTVNYTGFTSDGASFTGKIRITVANTLKGTVSYETNALTPVTFRASDFASAFPSGDLYRVVFSLPPSSQGTLYYGYTSTSGYLSEISGSTSFYISYSPYLSNVTFVPNSSFTGALAINYIAYSSSGTSSSGSVLITVKSSEMETITYSTATGDPVQFNAEDFNTVFLNRTGSSLYYVRFDIPSSSAGKLFLDYDSPTSYSAAVTASGKYYRSYSPLLSDVYFVPASSFDGPAVVSYTGYTISGTAYTGKVIINVGSASPFDDLDNYPWASDAINYLYRNGVVTGSGNNMYDPSGIMSRGDFVLMIARAFGLSGGADSTSDNFSDVPESSYYYDAIAAAKAYGIVAGSNGKFNPAVAISRQDAMVIIKRALDANGISIATGDGSDISNYADASGVSGYAVEGVASLVKAGIVTGNGGMLRPNDLISRAEMAVILYRVLTV